VLRSAQTQPERAPRPIFASRTAPIVALVARARAQPPRGGVPSATPRPTIDARYAQEAIAQRREVRALLRRMRRLIDGAE